LLLVVHHLAVDGVSWRILLDDLRVLIDQNHSGSRLDLGTKSSSYREWQDGLVRYGSSSRSLSQVSYWEGVLSSGSSLPVDMEAAGPVLMRDWGTVSVCLPAYETGLLLQGCSSAYQTEINDLLLSALAQTIIDWSGEGSVLIGLEGHGREEHVSGLELHRTVGWFTSLFPVRLQGSASGDWGDVIKQTKETLRGVPDKGLGFGVLQYLAGEGHGLSPVNSWELVFNYLGQFDNLTGENPWFEPAGEYSGAQCSAMHSAGELLSVNSMVTGGSLELHWGYSGVHYQEATVRKLAGSYVSHLQSLIRHCMDRADNPERTPSDYGLGQQVSYQQLDEFISSHRGVSSLYRLSGLQEGMLFHSLYDDQVRAYIEQFVCELSGIDEQVFASAWGCLLSRHSILRTGFFHETFSVAVQAVFSEVDLPVQYLDYSGLPLESQQSALSSFELADRSRGFDFTRPPLMRLTLARLGSGRYRMIWTSHHILFDGWSLPVLLEELQSYYGTLVSGGKPDLSLVDQYEDYIRLIESRDVYQERAHWESYLSGLERAVLLPFISSVSDRTKGIGEYAHHSLSLSGQVTAQIHRFCQGRHITLNTLMQAVWSYLLHSYTGEEHVLFGVTVSGRPEELSDVERRVGLYINTLPLHARVDPGQPVWEWLQSLQSDQVLSRQYQHSRLRDIQQWTGLSGDLFDTILVFENYPVSKAVFGQQALLAIEQAQMHEHINYPLGITVAGSQELWIGFTYNSRLLDKRYVASISGHFQHVLLQIVGGQPDQRIGDLSLLTAPERIELLESFNATGCEYPSGQTFTGIAL
jgi:non-ribosomal peptide synthase protein (TIGR01720 family)